MKRKIIEIFILTLLMVTAVLPVTTSETCPIQWPDQKQTEYGDQGWFVNEDFQVAQSFVPTKDILSQVRLFISKQGNPEHGITVSIRENLAGDDLATKSVSLYFGDENYDWFTFDFSDITVTPGEKYYIIAQADECESKNCYGWICADDDDAYPNGEAHGSDDKGQTWELRDKDCCFITYSTKSKSINTPYGNPSDGIWFVRGLFKFLDEDEEYIYLKAISAKLRGLGNGVAFYHLFFCPIKISKPLTGIFTNDFSIVVFGICDEWDYIET